MNDADRKAGETLLRTIAKHPDYLAFRVFCAEIVRGTRGTPSDARFELGRLDGVDMIFRFADRMTAPKKPKAKGDDGSEDDPYKISTNLTE